MSRSGSCVRGTSSGGTTSSSTGLRTSAACTITRNVIATDASSPDSGVLELATAGWRFDCRANYWLTTEASRISQATGSSDTILWWPYRLGTIDTAAGADTMAPETTTIVSADTATVGSITIVWNAVAVDEAGVALTDFLRYRVYRSTVADSDW